MNWFKYLFNSKKEKRTTVDLKQRQDQEKHKAVVNELTQGQGQQSAQSLNKRALCFNFSNLNFDRAFGVPNFTRVWLPHLVRHHKEEYDLRYFSDVPLPSHIEDLVKFNGILPLGDQSDYFQLNFSHFQKRLPRCKKLMIFVHDFHAISIPWKYNRKYHNILLGNIYYSDKVATYFPTSSRLCAEYGAKQVVDLPFFSILDLDEHAESELARDLLDQPGKKIFYPSDCQVHKNHYTLIKALSELRQQMPDLKLILTGFKEDREHCIRLAALIDELELEDNIIWHGAIADEDVVELYRACDIVLQASLAEGGAMIATEAMSLGKAVCVADIPQARSALEQNRADHVFWFDPLSVTGLKKAITSALAATPDECGMLRELLENRDLAARKLAQSW